MNEVSSMDPRAINEAIKAVEQALRDHEDARGSYLHLSERLANLLTIILRLHHLAPTFDADLVPRDMWGNRELPQDYDWLKLGDIQVLAIHFKPHSSLLGGTIEVSYRRVKDDENGRSSWKSTRKESLESFLHREELRGSQPARFLLILTIAIKMYSEYLEKLVAQYGETNNLLMEFGEAMYSVLTKNLNLIGSLKDDLREILAKDDSTPPEILRALASDVSSSVRAAVASNPKTPPEALAKLASDKDRWVRLAVASNPSAPPDALERLASDEDEKVRNAALNNPNCPPRIHARVMVE